MDGSAPLPFDSGEVQRSASLESLEEFKDAIQKDAVSRMHQDIVRLSKLTPEKDRKEMDRNFSGFEKLFRQYVHESGHKVDWAKINPPPKGTIRPHRELPDIANGDEADLLKKLVVLKLNGGLGTSMGCKGPKSAISVRDDLTFLDLTVRQLENLNATYGIDVPLVLMNSFNTHTDTQSILRKYTDCNVKILNFNQSRYPRILKESLTPVPRDFHDESEWYPPGHGDLYESLESSGCLDQLLAMGKEYIFISNVDNLGATVDMRILNFMVKVDPKCEFIMEVTDKTRADVKGGTLIEYEGGLRLLELAQVSKAHVAEFQAINKFRIFNTNNLWIKLSAIKELVGNDAIHMEVIENKKALDNGCQVIQLETAVGSGIKSFKNAIGVNVDRSRFLPVKKTSDLLLVMSDLYTLKQGSLTMSPQRLFPTVPLVKLGDDHFKKVHEFLFRFESVPNILELDHLTVSGDVTFGRNVVLKGTVIIIANFGDRIDIPSGAILENKIVTGNLRILDH